MVINIDYTRARELLDSLFAEAETYHPDNQLSNIAPTIVEAADRIFASNTQSYREALLGCALAKLLDRSINVSLPYASHGEGAFNGRTLDEQVINPFLNDKRIPSSRGPYLATFRRNVKFVSETASGLRDKVGYDAFLEFLNTLANADDATLRRLVLYLLCRFVWLRNAAVIPLSRIRRLSLEQLGLIIERLLQIHSGGLLPVLLTVSMLRTLKSCYELQWDVQWQGINVADAASGSMGDVTVRNEGVVLLAIEITERRIDKARVTATFNTKIMNSGIEDYLYIYTKDFPDEEAKAAARAFFSQGHEIGFLQIRDWIVNNLATIGSNGRERFTAELLTLLDARDVPAILKVAWNDSVRDTVSV